MNAELIRQLVNIFRGNIRSDDIYTFAYQLLAWVRLSKRSSVPVYAATEMGATSEKLSLLFDPKNAPRDIKVVIQIFNRLAEDRELPNGLAFSHVSAAISHITPGQLLQALEMLDASNLYDPWPVDDLVQHLMCRNNRSNNVLPNELSSLMVAACQPSESAAVYLPFENSYQLAALTLDFGCVPYTETLIAGPTPWLINMLSDKYLFIHVGDSIKNPGYISDGRMRRFDSCVAFPPLNFKYEVSVSQNDRFQRFIEETTSMSVLSIRHIAARTKNRAVIAIPNGLLFSPGAERALRNDLLEKNIIEAVIALPPALMPGTTLSFSLLVLRFDRPVPQVLFIDGAAEEFHSKDGRGRATLTGWEGIKRLLSDPQDTKHSRRVPVDEIIANDAQLQVSRYCRGNELGAVDALLNRYKTYPLFDLVTIHRPALLEKEVGIDVLEVAPGDFPEYGYAEVPGRQVKISAQKSLSGKRQFLQPNDIVIVVKGSVGKVAIISPNAPDSIEGGWIAGQSCLVLRVEDRTLLEPIALFTFLKSEAGQLLLKQIVSGAAVPLIQLRELEKIRIPVPSKEQQAKLVANFEEIVAMEASVVSIRQAQRSRSAEMWSFQ